MRWLDGITNSMYMRYLLLLITILLTGGIIFLTRSCKEDTAIVIDSDKEEIYSLNDSIYNRHSESKATRKMELYIERWMARNNIRGASLAIMKEEKLIYCRGFGWADQERGEVVEAGTIFRKASA